MVALQAPPDRRLTPEELADRLDDANGSANRASRAAATAALANSLEAALEGALATHIAWKDAADTYGAILSAVEGMVDACTRRANDAKAALTDAVDASGIPQVETATHTATPTQGKPSVVIYDEAALPPGCIREKFEPDKEKIRARLITDQPVPGARLVDGKPGMRVAVKSSAKRGTR